MDADLARALAIRFLDAWNAHDVDSLMACMTDDCRFYAAAGSGPDGALAEGAGSVRAAYAAIFERFPDARWDDGAHRLAGDEMIISTWTFHGTSAAGPVRVRGCDLLTLREDRIHIKDSYRKQIAAAS
jgi:hypothetical protein